MVRIPRWKRLPVTTAIALATLFLASHSFAAEVPRYALGLGVDFASGDYGSNITTRSVRVPVTLDYFASDRLDFELIIPYLYQNNSNTVFAGGMRFPAGSGGGGGMMQTSYNFV